MHERFFICLPLLTNLRSGTHVIYKPYSTITSHIHDQRMYKL